MSDYFFDSYAIIELLRGNPNYAMFVNEPVLLTVFNLVEIYWFALREYSEKDAEKIYEKYSQSVIELDDEILKEAIKFRKKNKKMDLSYADCIGYIYALKNNLVFLTGDKEFKNMKNVEFVK
tara:strand:- start:1113 stop:1478 length:366 start_codon:yes stop_codon:yes gene_type:complete